MTAATPAKPGVQLAITRDVAYLTLDAPPLNILTAALMDELGAALEKIAAEKTAKAVALTATGKAFSAGADIGEHAPDAAPRMIASFSRLFDRFAALDIPVVMLVNGAALGGGFEVALMAHVLLATEKASFGQPEIRLGFIAPVGLAALPSRVGYERALEITCSGRKYSAEEMAAMGLVSKVVPSAESSAALEAVLDDFRQASPLVLRLNVRALKQVRHMAFEAGHKAAEKIFLNDLMATEDVREGLAAFLGKRPPAWKNR